MSRRPWWWPWRQPAAPDELNEPDEQHTVHVPTRLDWRGESDEGVWTTPDAADQWDARVWRDRP